MDTCRIRRLTALALVASTPLAAQERIVESHRRGDPEGQLLAYYAAALAFSPVGAATAGPRAPWSADAGVELSFLPPLSEAQRTSGFQKTESTNLAPVVPRPRLVVALPGGALVEASWVPPITAFGVTANLVSVALSRRLPAVGGVTLTPRLAGSTGHVTGPITCNADLNDHGGGDSLYFDRVCHGRESADRFEPRALSGELLASRPVRDGALVPYLGLGARVEHERFDVGVRNADGSRDRAHPILDLHAARGYGMAGASWRGGRRLSLGAELFYVPGSLVTARALASLRVRGR